MKVLITGGHGYIGCHLTEALISNAEVATLDSMFSSVEDFQPVRGVIRHKASTTNPDAVGRAMSGAHVVYHLANRHDWDVRSSRHPMRLADANLKGLVTVLTMARATGIDRIIHTSCASVYGNIIGAIENDTCVPVDFHGAMKLAEEAICRAFYNLGLEIVILRLGQVWGGHGSHSVVNQLLRRPQDALGHDADDTLDLVFIDDVIRALKWSRRWDSGIYNIGTGVESTIGGLWKLLVGEGEPNVATNVTGMDRLSRMCLDQTYTEAETGWKPKVLLTSLNRDEIVDRCK
jgi:nucleoside-diphosphate-sugar epimerase